MRWNKVDERVLLNPESAAQLRSEGRTMVLIRTGLWKTRQVSLIRYMQRVAPRNDA